MATLSDATGRAVFRRIQPRISRAGGSPVALILICVSGVIYADLVIRWSVRPIGPCVLVGERHGNCPLCSIFRHLGPTAFIAIDYLTAAKKAL